MFFVGKIANSCLNLGRLREKEVGQGSARGTAVGRSRRAGGLETRSLGFLDFRVEAALCDLVETIEDA